MKILELFYKYLISGPQKVLKLHHLAGMFIFFFSHLNPGKMFSFIFFVATNGLLFY